MNLIFLNEMTDIKEYTCIYYSGKIINFFFISDIFYSDFFIEIVVFCLLYTIVEKILLIYPL